MRKSIGLIYLMLIALHPVAQETGKYVVEGRLKGLKNGTVLSLFCVKEVAGKYEKDTISTAIARDEKFNFSGHIDLEGTPCFIMIDTIRTKYDLRIIGNGSSSVIFLENKKVHINGVIDNIDPVVGITTVEGLEGEELYIEWVKVQDTLNNVENSITQTLSKDLSTNEKLLDSTERLNINIRIGQVHDSINQLKKYWLNKHLNSILSPWLIQFLYGGEAVSQKMYNNLPFRIQISWYGTRLNEFLDIKRKTAIGVCAPDFIWPDSANHVFPLHDVVKKGRLTILDFWASWCAPCRKSIPELKNIYEKYKGKGLVVIGYSVDTSPELWLKALRHDSIPWFNVREKSAVAATLYGVNAIPQTYLLDDEGIIIAKDLEPAELEKKIDEILMSNNPPSQSK